MKMIKYPAYLAGMTTAIFFSTPLFAQSSMISNPAISGVLEGYYQEGERPLSETEKGFGLGHTELAMSANIDDYFFGKLTTVIEQHDGDIEVGLEEAFIQTLALPAGFSLRAGRFLSDIGYLNNQHTHSDSFVQRPLAYRAFVGGHYFDDGLRINYVAPTDIYWLLGVEAFTGKSLRSEAHVHEGEALPDYKTVGAMTAYSKWGGDIGLSSSWQFGLSYLRNEAGTQMIHEEHAEHEGHEEHEAEIHEAGHDEHSGHSHNAAYTGKNTYIADAVFKWAPEGNYKYQNLTLSAEYFLQQDLFALEHDGHIEQTLSEQNRAWYVSGVYQFLPQWSAGVRYGQADVWQAHGDHLHQQEFKETDVMLAWHHSHFSTVRLQYSYQQGNQYADITDDHIVTLQYVMTLGAHGAHQF